MPWEGSPSSDVITTTPASKDLVSTLEDGYVAQFAGQHNMSARPGGERSETEGGGVEKKGWGEGGWESRLKKGKDNLEITHKTGGTEEEKKKRGGDEGGGGVVSRLLNSFS